MNSAIKKSDRGFVNIDTKDRLKVLFVMGEFPAISNPFILNQITGLIDQGHDVSIFALQADEQQDPHSEVDEYNLRDRLHIPDKLASSNWGKINNVVINGISILVQRPGIFLSATKAIMLGHYPLSFRFFHQLSCVANFPRNDFDIIHAQFGPHGNLVMMLKEFGVLKGKLVTQFRGFDVSLVIRSKGEHYYDSLFAYGDLFLPVCDHIKAKIMQLGAPKEKTFVHYSGINIEKFTFQKRDFQATSLLKIGSIGRLSSKKGYEYVIKALGLLKSEGFDFTYRIVGDGELKNDVAGLIHRYGLSGNVTLLGAKNHDYIADFLHEIDIFISHNVTADSGDEEGIPNTLKEAMLSGVPVFSTYHAGIPELIDDEVNGFLTEEKNIQELVDKLKKHAFPLTNLDGISNNARETVVQMFENDKLNGDLINHYYSILR